MQNFNVKNIRSQNGFRHRIEQSQKKYGFKFKSGMLFIFVIIILLLFTYVLPTVRVTVVPFTQDLEKEFNISLTTDQNKVGTGRDLSENNIFLAEIVQVNQELEGKFDATGEKDIGDKAHGQARFLNDTGRSQPITTGIDLISDAGVIVAVKENITIPGAKVDEQGNVVPGVIVADVEAKQAGEKGNIGPGRINISALDLERQAKIYGEITQAGLTGGTSEIVTVVSQDDIDNAKEELIKEVENEIRDKLSKQADDNFFVSEKLIVYDDSEIYKEVNVDAKQDNFELGINLKVRALAFNNKNLRETLREQILSELPADQTIADTEFGPEYSGLDIQVENFDLELGLAELKIKAVFPVSETIDLDTIKQNILGKDQTEARRYILSQPNVKDVQFSFSFSLTNKIPESEKRVKIKLGEIK